MKKNLPRDQKVLMLKMKLNMETSDGLGSSSQEKMEPGRNPHEAGQSQQHHNEALSLHVGLKASTTMAKPDLEVMARAASIFSKMP